MKKLLLIMCIFTLFTGCKEKGTIDEIHKDVYFLEKSYKDHVFELMEQQKVGFDRKVTFAAEDLSESAYDINPCSYVTVVMSENEYVDLIDNSQLFEADLDIVAVFHPDSGKLYTYIKDGSLESTIRKSLNSNEYTLEIPKDKAEDYIEKYGFQLARM